MRRSFAAFAFGLLAACGSGREPREWRPSDHTQPPGVTASGTPSPAPPVSAGESELRAGAALFRSRCASCHGATGHGDGPARSAAIAPPDLAAPAWQDARTDDAIATVIAQGRGAMPGFAADLGDLGIGALVSYVRSLREAAPAPTPPPTSTPPTDAPTE